MVGASCSTNQLSRLWESLQKHSLWKARQLVVACLRKLSRSSVSSGVYQALSIALIIAACRYVYRSFSVWTWIKASTPWSSSSALIVLAVFAARTRIWQCVTTPFWSASKWYTANRLMSRHDWLWSPLRLVYDFCPTVCIYVLKLF